MECGLRPVGAIGAYAPEGSGNAECGNIRQGGLNAEVGMGRRKYKAKGMGHRVLGKYKAQGQGHRAND